MNDSTNQPRRSSGPPPRPPKPPRAAGTPPPPPPPKSGKPVKVQPKLFRPVLLGAGVGTLLAAGVLAVLFVAFGGRGSQDRRADSPDGSQAVLIPAGDSYSTSGRDAANAKTASSGRRNAGTGNAGTGNAELANLGEDSGGEPAEDRSTFPQSPASASETIAAGTDDAAGAENADVRGERPFWSGRAAKEPLPDEAQTASAAPAPLDDLLRREAQLDLPQWQTGLSALPKPVELARILVDAPGDCELSLVGGQGSNRRPAFSLQAEDRTGSAGPARVWTVIRNTSDSFGAQVQAPVGRFTLQDRVLSFEWDAKTPAWAQPAGLRYQLLDVRVADETLRCTLTRPQQPQPVRLDFGELEQVVKIPVGAAWLPESAVLHLQLHLEGFPPARLAPAGPLQPGRTALIHVASPDRQLQFLELAAEFTAAESYHELRLKTYAYSQRKQPDGKLARSRTEVSRDRVMRERSVLRREQRTLKSQQTSADHDARKAAQELRRIDGQISVLTTKSASASTSSSQKSILDRQIEALNQRKDSLGADAEQIQDKLQETETFLNEKAAWCEQILQTFDQLARQAAIGYSLYFDLDGRRVYLFQYNKMSDDAENALEFDDLEFDNGLDDGEDS